MSPHGSPAAEGVRMRIVFLAVLVVAFFTLPPPPFLAARFAAGRPAEDCRRVLFVGNSLTYTHAIPANAERLANLLADGRSTCAVEQASPGVTLEWHWGQPGVQRLLEQRWDYVVLQEQSDRAYGEPDAMARSVERFVPAIRRSGAQPLLYAILSNTWPPEGRLGVRARVQRIAQDVGARVVPVDAVWSDLLHARAGDAIFDADQHHPGPYGAYSAALLFARCMAGPLRRPAAYVLAGERPPSTFRLLFARPEIDERAAAAAYRAVDAHAVGCGT
jgi:hypothetical protein